MSWRSRSMLGWMSAPITPPMRMWTPMTASSWGCVQPLSAGVWLKTRPRTASPVPSWIAAWRSWSQKFARYCRSFSAPIRKNSQASRSGRIVVLPRLACDRAVAPDREAPDDPDQDRADDDPQQLHRQAAQELLGRQVAHERLDRESERPLERQDVRDRLDPVRHQRHRHEPAGEQELGGDVE